MDLEAFKAGNDDVCGFYAVHGSRRETKPKPKGKRSTKGAVRLDLPQHEPGERFIMGPIPLAWMKAAAVCGYRSEAVGLLLWYAARWQKSNPVKLTPKILSELGIHPKTAKRSLEKMQSMGLVQVAFHRGRSPVVTIVSPNSSCTGD